MDGTGRKGYQGMRKKKLSITDFKNWCKKNTPKKFVFYTGNQAEDFNNLEMKAEYDRIDIGYAPNFVTLWDGSEYMSFRNVRHIQKWAMKDNVFDIVCKNSTRDKIYTVLAV